MRRLPSRERHTITIDLDDYLDLDPTVDEGDVDVIRDYIATGLRYLRGPSPSIQEAMLNIERALWTLDAACPPRKEKAAA